MSPIERFIFRVEVAKMIGDDDVEIQKMINEIGMSPAGGAEVASSIASLA